MSVNQQTSIKQISKKQISAIEPDNTNYIEELKKDTASNPKEPPDCSIWENSNEADWEKAIIDPRVAIIGSSQIAQSFGMSRL